MINDLTLDPKGLEAAARAVRDWAGEAETFTEHRDYARAAITAYLSATVPVEVREVADRLRAMDLGYVMNAPTLAQDTLVQVAALIERLSATPCDRDAVLEDAAKVAENHRVADKYEYQWPDLPFIRREIAARIRALQSAPPVTGWQDIATAPKDGTDFIYRTLGGEIGRCRWDDMDAQHFGAGWYDPQRDADCLPTHWMPLPNPPPRR